MSVELADKVYTHLLTGTPIDPATDIDLFSYNTIVTTASRYSSTVFIGIIVDTSASKKSISGYGQFKAL